MRICQRKYVPQMLSWCPSRWGIRGDDLEGLIKSQLTLPSSMVTSVVTSTIITTRLEG
eukprot:SAG11_NODE_11162_length_779_cov_5.382353_1_plen_57_part_01